MPPNDIRASLIDLPGLRHVGRRVLWFDELPSTNDYSATLATDPSNAGTVVVAGFQSRGRGQHGRVWQSRPGASLLLSALLFPPPRLRRPVVLTAWAAVGIADAIRDLCGADVRIKWPNDLFVGGKKVCGILIEQGHGTVVGVGLNLNQTAADFACAELPDATSLFQVGAAQVDPRVALRIVLHRLDAGYAGLIGGDPLTLEIEWRKRIGLEKRSVTAELADGSTATGQLRELEFDGLTVVNSVGELRVFPPEVVRRLQEEL